MCTNLCVKIICVWTNTILCGRYRCCVPGVLAGSLFEICNRPVIILLSKVKTKMMKQIPQEKLADQLQNALSHQDMSFRAVMADIKCGNLPFQRLTMAILKRGSLAAHARLNYEVFISTQCLKSVMRELF
jgi:hypothetical protein